MAFVNVKNGYFNWIYTICFRWIEIHTHYIKLHQRKTTKNHTKWSTKFKICNRSSSSYSDHRIFGHAEWLWNSSLNLTMSNAHVVWEKIFKFSAGWWFNIQIQWRTVFTFSHFVRIDGMPDLETKYSWLDFQPVTGNGLFGINATYFDLSYFMKMNEPYSHNRKPIAGFMK